MPRRIDVRVTFTVNIDPHEWANEYGLELADVRADIKQHTTNMVAAQLDTLGFDAVVAGATA